jgi:DNA-directed RNA polymerase subunit RPC12/RpoP
MSEHAKAPDTKQKGEKKEQALTPEDFIVRWPLYTPFSFDGFNTPPRISFRCAQCGKETTWMLTAEPGYIELKHVGETIKWVSYLCILCGHQYILVAYRILESGEEMVHSGRGLPTRAEIVKRVQKIGQHPPLEELAPEALQSALDTEDLALYKTAIRLRNFGLGLGAIAYLRRVVENRMNDMLDVLYAAAQEHNASSEILSKVSDVKADRRFSAKIDYAADLMPEHLRPAGQPNPIAILHELASEGLHSKSEGECVEIFDRCRKVFDYVFARLRVQMADAKEFVTGLADLARKGGPQAG